MDIAKKSSNVKSKSSLVASSSRSHLNTSNNVSSDKIARPAAKYPQAPLKSSRRSPSNASNISTAKSKSAISVKSQQPLQDRINQSHIKADKENSEPLQLELLNHNQTFSQAELMNPQKQNQSMNDDFKAPQEEVFDNQNLDEILEAGTSEELDLREYRRQLNQDSISTNNASSLMIKLPQRTLFKSAKRISIAPNRRNTTFIHQQGQLSQQPSQSTTNVSSYVAASGAKNYLSQIVSVIFIVNIYILNFEKDNEKLTKRASIYAGPVRVARKNPTTAVNSNTTSYLNNMVGFFFFFFF